MAASALEDPEQQHHEPARMENTSGAPSPANGSAVNLTDSEDDRQLREARTVLQDLEFQDHEREHARHEKGRPDQPSSATAPPPAHHSPLQRAAVYANLATFSILGAATRIGLTRLCTYNGQSVFATAVSQAVGCAVMGLVSRNKVPLESVDVALFIGLGTGYCGSVTTFSTWMFETFEAFSNAHHFHHGGVRNVVDGFTQLFITFAVATAGLRFGIHTSSLLHAVYDLATGKESSNSEPSRQAVRRSATSKHLFQWFCVLVGGLCLLAMLLLTILVPFYRHVTFALLFAPFGTFLRFWLGKANKYDNRIMYGTLSANLFATALLSACSVLQRTPSASPSPLSCGVLQGFVDGFCGCLSTVSTFAVELRGLRRLSAYLYAAISVVAGIALVVLIYGSVWWTLGMGARCAFQT